MTQILRLAHCEVLIDPGTRVVSTRFPDGRECVAMREDSDENQREAADEGYTGDDTVWRCLQDHEVLHSLCSEWLWQKPSPTLRHEAGAELAPYGIRLYEEAITISVQRFLQAGDMWPALLPFAEQLTRWRARYERTMERLEEAA